MVQHPRWCLNAPVPMSSSPHAWRCGPARRRCIELSRGPGGHWERAWRKLHAAWWCQPWHVTSVERHSWLTFGNKSSEKTARSRLPCNNEPHKQTKNEPWFVCISMFWTRINLVVPRTKLVICGERFFPWASDTHVCLPPMAIHINNGIGSWELHRFYTMSLTFLQTK